MNDLEKTLNALSKDLDTAWQKLKLDEKLIQKEEERQQLEYENAINNGTYFGGGYGF